AMSAGRPFVGVGWRDSPSTLFSESTTTVWILVPPRSIPPRASCFGAGLTAQTIAPQSGVLGSCPRGLPEAMAHLVGEKALVRAQPALAPPGTDKQARRGGRLLHSSPDRRRASRRARCRPARDRRGDAVRARLLADALGRGEDPDR